MDDFPSDIAKQNSSHPNIGTIEVQISILRQFGDSHSIKDVLPYNEVKNLGHDDQRTVGYDLIPPTLSINYKREGTEPLKRGTLSRRRQVMQALRPGKEIWARLRFHYRPLGKI